MSDQVEVRAAGRRGVAYVVRLGLASAVEIALPWAVAAADPALRAWARPFPAPGTGASACRLDVGDKDLSRVVESISEQARGEPVGSGSDP